ncbi:MAG: hypothetical protein ACE5FA_10480, partial [Dehalococcoidia bacterium]
MPVLERKFMAPPMLRRWFIGFLAILVPSLSPSSIARAAGVIHSEVLIDTGELGWERLGDSLDADGDTFIAGRPAGNPISIRGSASIYRWNGSSWSEEAQLQPFLSQGHNGDLFGQSVGIDGDIAVMGA